MDREVTNEELWFVASALHTCLRSEFGRRSSPKYLLNRCGRYGKITVQEVVGVVVRGGQVDWVCRNMYSARGEI